MKEIRTLIGITRQQLNALFDGLEAFKKIVSHNKDNAENEFWYWITMQRSDGGESRLSICKDNCRSIPDTWNITKVALNNDGSFTVQLVVKDPAHSVSVWNEKNACKIGTAPDGTVAGTLMLAPAITSRINYALGLAQKIEPLYLIPAK